MSARLQASVLMLRDNAVDAIACTSTAKEQALVYMVMAFDGTLGLDAELMRAVFSVAGLRMKAGSIHPPFRAKVCVCVCVCV